MPNPPMIHQPVPISDKTELPKASKLLSQTWNLYIKKFGLLVGIYLIPFLIFGVGVALYLAAKKGGTNLGGYFILLFFIFLIGAIYVCMWAGTALIQAIAMMIDNTEDVNFGSAFRKSKGKIWTMLGVGLLSGLAVGAGTILLVIPGIIFYVWFALSPYVCISEGLRDTNALGASKKLVHGKFWPVLWR